MHRCFDCAYTTVFINKDNKVTVIRKQDRILEVDEETVKIFDYQLPGVKVGISYQEASGRVPSEGSTANLVCEECCYILEGTGTITIDGEPKEVEPGDIAIVSPSQSCHLETSGIKYLTITNPDWYPEQNKSVG